MLSQQATQTANLFQAIDRNTQQMFANRFNVQQAEANLAINTIQQLDQSRVNDARIAALNVEMRQREQDIILQQRAMDLDARLAPLKEQAERSRLQSTIQTNAAAAINPQFDDLKPEIANVIFENPDIADDVQQEYMRTLNALGQDSLRPDVDIVSRVNQEKQRLKSYLDQYKRKSNPALDMNGKPLSETLSTDWLTNKFSNREVKPYDVGRASAIYKAFGGDENEFKLKNDPKTKQMMEAEVRHARVTGKINMNTLAMQSPEVQDELNLIFRNKDREKELIELSQSLRSSISTISKSIEDGNDTEDNRQQLSYFSRQLSAATRELISLNPIEEEKEQPDPVRIQAESDLNNLFGGFTPSGDLPKVEASNNAKFNRAQATKFERKLEPILKKIIPQGAGEIVADKNRILGGQNQLDASMVEKYVSSAKDNAIDTLVRQDWFINHIKEEGLMTTLQPVQSGRGIVNTTVPSGLSNAIRTIQNTDADIADRKEAINYLKSRLTGILLDYANQ